MCNNEVMVIVMYSYGISTCSGSTAMMCGTLYAYSVAAGTNGMMDGELCTMYMLSSSASVLVRM